MNDWKKILEQLPDDDKTEGSEKADTAQTSEKPKGRRGLTVTLIVMLALALIFGGLWMYKAADRIYGYDRIYPGVTALNIDLGGMTIEEAQTAIETYSDNYFSGKQINVICGDSSVTISARDASIVVDSAEVARQAYNYGRTGGFFKRYSLVTSHEIPPLSVGLMNGYDSSYVESKVDELVAAVNVEYKQYGYVMADNGITVTKGRDGVSLDRESTVAKVKSMLENNAYGDLVITADVRKADVPDWSVLRNTIFVEAKNAKVKKSGSRGYYIEPEVNGRDIDIDQINRDMYEEGWEVRTYAIVTTVPDITEAALSQMLFKDRLATVTTDLNEYEYNRTENIRLSAAAVNGYILLDYDDADTKAIENQFSFNGVVGERTEARGYKSSIVFTNEDMVDGIGGGICQLSSTLYVASLISDMKIIERHTHTFAVSYVGLGMDATVQWGYLDYIFENNTGYPVRIEASINGGELTVNFWGTNTNPSKSIALESRTVATYKYQTVNSLNASLAPGTSTIIQNGKNGFKAELYQIVYNGTDVVEQRLANTSYYKALDEKVQYGPSN